LQRNMSLYNAQWPLASLLIYTETFQVTGFVNPSQNFLFSWNSKLKNSASWV